MGMFEGKKGLVLGVANDRSIALAIANFVMQEGGVCGFTHLPDRPDDEKKKNRRRVEKCIDGNPAAKFLLPLDVSNEDQMAEIVDASRQEFGQLDFILHSVAFASLDDLKGDTIDTSRDGFKMAMDISVYSLIAVCRAARDVLADGASVLCMSYMGGEKCIPGYNVMGICKAALEATTRYLAFDLGPQNVRVNALSAGPLKTLAGSAAGVNEMLKLYEQISPLGRNISHDEVGKTGGFLLSPMSNGITGEVLHVDAGYNIMGSPGRLADKLKGL